MTLLAGDSLACDINNGEDDEDNDGAMCERAFFKFVLTKPSNKKSVKVPIGTGGRVTRDNVLVTLHKPLQVHPDSTSAVVEDRPLSTQADPVFTLDAWYLQHDEVKELFIGYCCKNIRWTLPGFRVDGTGADCEALCNLLRMLMAGGSHTGGRGFGYSASEEDLGLLTALECAQYVQQRRNKWWLTELGTRSVRSCTRVSEPFKVFDARPELLPSLQDHTAFELMVLLASSGWRWKSYVCASKRRKKDEPIPLVTRLARLDSGSPHRKFQSST